MPEATYTIGLPTHPPVAWDNGFSVTKHSPTARDYALLAEWIALLNAGEAGQKVPLLPHNDLSDALAAYRHYLYGNGKDRIFSYERYVTNDLSGKTTLENALSDIEEGAEQLYRASLAGQPANFKITGTAIKCGRRHSAEFPYPVTENWQKAIGYHVIWLSSDVAVTLAANQPNFSMVVTVHAEDRYNFNNGAADIATGIPDSANGELEAAGLAYGYMNYSTLQRTVRWTDASAPVLMPTSGRTRQPQDNRRLRNRL